MRCIPLQGLRFGEGLPKLCVPLTGNGMPALLSELQQVADLPADLFEWRLDCFFGNPLPVLPQVLENLGDKPLLCTLRTQGEGGQARLSPEEYERQEKGGMVGSVQITAPPTYGSHLVDQVFVSFRMIHLKTSCVE